MVVQRGFQEVVNNIAFILYVIHL